MRDSSGNDIPIGKIITLVVLVVITIAIIASIGNLFESLNANQIMVIQSPVKGTLNWHTTAGIKWQGFGKVTKYNKRDQFWFSAKKDQGQKGDESIRIRFNDGGHANVSGSLAWEMPMDNEHLTMLHTQYGSQEAIQHQLIRTVTEKSVYMTGPLMSSKESYAERRNDLLLFVEDQIRNGVFLTETIEEKQVDPITNQTKTVNVVKVRPGTDGKPLRADSSPIDMFSLKIYNLSINEVAYSPEVEKQITSQQQAIMEVQTAVANSKRAEQEALTTAKQGEANAAKSKWEQEAVKAKAVTQAQQELEVAQLNTKAAEQFKMAETLKGEGEGARRRLAMEADGALDKKLVAYVEVNKAYADAIAKYPGHWVPGVVMGGTPGQTQNGATDLINLLTLNAAKQLSLDMSLPLSVPAPAKK